MDRLEALIRDLIERKNAAREGSAERSLLIRELQGVARHYRRGGGLIEYYDPEAAQYGIY